jgi:hypothetical protein
MRRIRLTEGQLHNVIRESVGRILNEISKDKKMMCMKKARDLGRDDQADNFADSLIDDLKPYEYGNCAEHFTPYRNGNFYYNRSTGNGLGFTDDRFHDGVMNAHGESFYFPNDHYYDYDDDYYTDEVENIPEAIEIEELNLDLKEFESKGMDFDLDDELEDIEEPLNLN